MEPTDRLELTDQLDKEGEEDSDVTEVIEEKEEIDLREAIGVIGVKDLKELIDMKDQEGTEIRKTGEIVRIGEIVMKGLKEGKGDKRPEDKILPIEEIMIGVSEEKETNKEKIGDLRDMETIETKEEFTRKVIMKLLRRTIRKEKCRSAISKRLAKEPRRSSSLS